ncbi:uncharacterized protein LOC123535800 [Mercenaria mercenaria]|uniref:uncharacterized protein LOC123535800 n=1 Tax=Mercenaria mercenaria TaxID=6596 RepID=UPI00234F9ECF|nr:uncharacterized protein LOC123535800 [Mercenaria mercenaria]
MKEPSFAEIRDIVMKARSCSAPGPSGIPYKVYKKCPKLLKRLSVLLRVIWKKGKVPECWKQAEGCFIPKEKNSKTIKQFRTISLLSVEGKIFFSVLARRLTTYMTTNKYVDISVQKGGIPGLSGCVEHTSALTQLLHEARINHSDLTVVWLDLANAYGSIPHELIKKSLEHYHIPDHARSLIMNYFDNIHLRFSCSRFTTNWLQLQKGIVTGCTISVILFVMGMNMILKAAERETRGPKTSSGIRLPSNRGFMDDMTVTTESHIQTRWILKVLDKTITWARIQFKPAKSRCLIVKKGKVMNKFKLFIQDEEIPALANNPIKCLGKWFDSSMTDKDSKNRLHQQVHDGLRRIDKCELQGKFKAWIYQHSFLPRLVWPLMVYELPLTTVEKLEQAISKHLRRWLGLPPSFTSIGLYGHSNKLQLPINSLVEEFKVAKARLLLTLRDSKDNKISGAGIDIRTGRKWSVSHEVERAESSLKHQDIVGSTNRGREGLGTRSHQSWADANLQERRSMVQSEIRRSEEQERSAKAIQFGSQGNWTKWTVPERKLTWNELWTYEPLQLSFLLRSVYDMLPTPTNLYQWKLTEDQTCPLCEKKGSLRHILSGCPTALSQGRYRWRHDKVLGELAHVLEKDRRKVKPLIPKSHLINFVREGEKKPVSTVERGILQNSKSWDLRADLGKKLQFPEEIAHTTLRPDIVIWSRNQKTVIMVELTVPWEERVEESNELKREKYEELANTCRGNGWKTWVFPVEVGCRGFPSSSVWRMLGALGIKGATRKTSVHVLSKAAERASCWLWLQRSNTCWKPTQTG